MLQTTMKTDVYSDQYEGYSGYERPVSRGSRLPDRPVVFETSDNVYDSISLKEKCSLNRIKVSNFSEKCSESFLENFFESKKTFGRDLDVVKVDFHQRAGYAIVIFKDASDAATVLEVHKDRPCVEHGYELNIELYVETRERDSENDTRSIEVRGFSPDTGADTIRCYFESKRHGGGPTLSFKMSPDKSSVIITFEDEKVVEEVIQKEHRIDNKKLIVKKFILSKTDILFTSISPDASEDAIQYFLEAKITSIDSVVFSEDRSKVLVTFAETIDFENVEKSCNCHSLHGCHMTPHPVAVTDSIIVTNIGEDNSMTADTFRYYFENPRRSSGGDVYDVQLYASEGYCLVFFTEPRVVQSVCSKDEHTLIGKLLQVKPYNLSLGLPAGIDSKFSFPEPVILDSISGTKIQYLQRNRTHKDNFERNFEDMHAIITWDKPYPKIECVLTSSMRNYRQLARSWAKNVQKIIDDFNEMIEVKEFEFCPDELEDIKSALDVIDIEDAEHIIVKIDKHGKKVDLVAPKSIMFDVAGKIEKTLQNVKDDYRKKKERRTEKKPLKDWNLKDLKCISFVDAMKQSFPDVDIEIREDICEIIVTGPQNYVSEILLQAYEIIDQAHFKTVSLEKGQEELLSHGEVADKVNTNLREKNLGDVWMLRESGVIFYAEDHGDLRRMENLIEKMLSKISVDLEKQTKGLLKSKEWNELERKLNNDFPGYVVIQEEERKLNVYTIDEIEEEVDKRLKGFFCKNTFYKEEISVDPNVMKLIQRYMKGDLHEEMKSIGKKGKPLKFEIQQSKVSIEGTSSDLNSAKTILKKFVSEVVSKQHTLNQRGIFIYISSAKGKESIKNVETSAMCIIDVMGKGLGSSIGKGRAQGGARNFDKPTHCAEANLKSGQKVIVLGGDMTQLSVDVIVNAANKTLQHAGGLAAVIARKGGRDIQQDCERCIKQNGSLSVGEVFISKSGNLQCAAVAHTVGPIWKDGNQGEEHDLKLAVENCLKETDSKKYTSIALPALSAGIYGYPVKQACLVIAKTIQGYFKVHSHSPIKEIYLCDISVKTVQGFVEAAQSTFKHVKILSPIENTTGTDQKKAWLMESSTLDPDPNPKTLFGNCNVKLVKGEITKERVDVIVNSTSPDLRLEKGKSSEAVLKAGGSNIQDECNKKYPHGIQTGEVAITTGGKLHCRELFHIALEPYKKHKTMHPIQGLKKSVIACLDQAVNQGYKSISFPAMGTGAQGYPRDKVAHEMYSTVSSYSKRYQNMCLTTIRFVVYHHDEATFEAFICEEGHWFRQRDEINTGSNNPGFGKIIKCKRDYGEFEFGQVEVKIFQGDITEQDTVAIVASCNRDLDLSKGAVTRALVKKGGTEIEKDCFKQKLKMQKKGILVTTAGQLKTKYIIYVDTKYKTEEWEFTMLKCLEKAEKHHFKSLSFPALGTSVGCKPDDIGRLMSSALASFHQQSPRYLQQVRVVIYQTEMLSPFIDGLKSSVSSEHSPRRPSNKRSDVHKHGNKNKTSNVDDTCSLTIYGRNENVLRKAIHQLEKHVEKDWMKKVIKDKIISSLHKSKIKQIEDSASNNHVLVDIDMNRSEVILIGPPRNIIDVSDEVNKLMHAFESSLHEKKLAKLVTNTIKWFYVKDNKSYPFPDRENLTIETAYERKDKTVRVKDRSGGEYEISFNDMEEWDTKQPKTKFPVIRKDLTKDVGQETPKHWVLMKDCQQLKLVTLASTDKEYQEVLKDFTSTLGRQPKISKIERIQNVTLYAQYAAKKKQMQTINPKQKNERLLWHGTAANALDSINNHGFNRSYCGKNATAFGAGVYFAVQSQYSDQDKYAPRDGNGNKHIYRARVLTGDYTVGDANLRVPPAKDAKNPHILFDSVTNSVSNPIMFVIFHDTQAYPEHVITYQ